ncbi:MAG: DUF4358 domain-containing protein [Saccharofermentanales bacterium]
MKKKKHVSIIILKHFSVFLMLLYMASLLFFTKTSTANFADVQKATMENVNMQVVKQAENRLIKRFYGLDATNYANIILFYPVTNMGAEEIFLVQLHDQAQSADVVEAIERRLTAQKKSFEGYGVEQTELLNNSIISVRGNYILFVVNSDAKEIDQAFRDSL